MKSLATILISTAVALVAVFALAYSGLYDVSASSPHGGIVNWLLSTTSHASVGRRAKGIEVPELDDDALALAGVSDFESMCTACHGAPGQEPEAMGKGLNPSAPDLSESAKKLTPAELFWITKNGIKMTGMPAWGKTHEDDDLWPVVAFMTRLPELDSDGYQAMLASADGLGHHAGDAADGEHSHADESGEHALHEHSDRGAHDPPRQQDESPAVSEEHDHSTHEH